MIQKIKSLSYDLQITVDSLLRKIKYEHDYKICTEDIVKEFFFKISSIKKIAIEELIKDKQHTSEKLENFINHYENVTLKSWSINFFNMLEKTQPTINNDFIQKINDLLNCEIQYIFKNVQAIVSSDLKLNCILISHNSCCELCNFFSKENYNNENIESFFLNDDCDSYLKLNEQFLETENLICNGIKIYNVPKKLKKSISTFYSLTQSNFNKIIKNTVKIKFFNDIDELNIDNIDNFKIFKNDIEYIYDKQCYYIKFNLSTYKYYLLRSLLEVKEIPNCVKDLYYKKIQRNNEIFRHKKFINYLAEQNSEDYFIESCICYILDKELLRNIDNDTFIMIDEKLFEQHGVI